ncbi:c-type cytochrome biogenesis protein CcmI [Teredinibacter waterburyi]|uniref:c-type cytochrome biogenesis protein CcmI n=1 Tax=Teredinibacter waterburyi TaxID=1500538 RepID=UPI00165ED6A2|nr:c-type cytochrome biogenesis protein CcmI [Teredinibacter waterburyi]
MDIPFWQGFLVLCALAALFILWPVLVVKRNQKQSLLSDVQGEANETLYEEHLKELEATHVRGEIDSKELANLRRDLERTMTADSAANTLPERPVVSSIRSRFPVIGLVVALPIVALIMYQMLGAGPDWSIYKLARERVQLDEPKAQLAATENLIRKLQERVSDRPGNAQNWYLLATVASDLGEYHEAVRALRRVLELEPNAPQVMAELAQALYLAAGNTVTPEVSRNTQMALQLNPNMPTALGLAGIEAFQSGAYQSAIDHWSLAVSQLDPKSSASQALTGGILRAQMAMEKSGVSSAKTAKSTKSKAEAPKVSVSVAVSFDDSIVNAKPEDLVFVYARAWQGPKMPLAIRKLTVADLPVKIVLDETMSMAPGMDLKSFPQIEVVARIAISGSAIPESGDWQASIGPVILADKPGTLSLKISEQIP